MTDTTNTPTPLLRPNTPDRTETAEDGRTFTVITLKRYCDAGHLVGDATEDDIDAVIEGRPMPAVLDCVECRAALAAGGGA